MLISIWIVQLFLYVIYKRERRNMMFELDQINSL
jgi:hypothetical protein